MPRREGLRPIGDSVKKIIEKIRKEREERQNRNKPVRTQPKLPGMKNGGGADARNPSIREYANILKDKDKVTEADMERARKRLMSNDPISIITARDQVKAVKKMKQKKKDDDKVKASLREISARGMMKGGEVKGYMSGGFGIFSKKKAKADEPDKKESQAEKKKRRLEELKKEMGMKDGGISRREEGRKRKPKGGIPSLPGKPKKRQGPPSKDRKDLDKTKNQPKSDFGVEYDRDGPSRPGKNITGYAVKKGGLIGGQKKLDANKDGKISGDDFKILRGKNNKMKGGGIAIRGTNFKGVY